MLKQNKIIIIIGIVVFIFFLIVIFWPTKKEKAVSEKQIVAMVPASVVIVPTQDKTPLVSDTGAMKTIMTDDQYKLMSLINILRNNCPVKNDYFEINYDYSSDRFVVNVPVKNMATFLKWKNDTGYNFISDRYWEIKQ